MWPSRSPRAEPVRVFVGPADAGLRSAWRGADKWRGLSEVGHQQARAVVSMLADLTVLRILSSPFLRCRQTVLPLALACGLDVESCWQLGPDVPAEDAMGLISDAETASSVICTDRETLRAISERLAGRHRAAVGPRSDPMDGAAVWTLHGVVSGAKPLRLEYLGSGARLGGVSSS